MWDRMWRGLLVTKPLFSDSWAHLVAYLRPPLRVSIQDGAVRDA